MPLTIQDHTRHNQVSFTAIDGIPPYQQQARSRACIAGPAARISIIERVRYDLELYHTYSQLPIKYTHVGYRG